MAVSGTHIYSPLDYDKREIRLVTIKPPSDNSAYISGSFSIHSLADAPPYYTLSYVWGDATVTTPIQLEGSYFQVTLNLFDALQQLSSKLGEFLIWIDAICINQEDVDEKNHQIPLMWYIYKSSRECLAWLGKEGEDTRLAFDLLKRWSAGFSNWIRVDIALSRLIPGREGGDLWAGNVHPVSFVEDPFNEESWEALATFLQRPYWSRIWPVQEIIAAEEVTFLCGPQSIDLFDLRSALHTWSGLAATNRDLLDSKDKHMIRRSGFGAADFISAGKTNRSYGSFGVLNVVVTARGKQCKDPRDKVYAMLGLLDEKITIHANYRKPVEEVYSDFTASSILGTGSLNILSAAGIGHPRSEEHLHLPSWVPQLTELKFELLNRGMSGEFSAAADLEIHASFSEALDVFSTKGVVFCRTEIVQLGGEPDVEMMRLWYDSLPIANSSPQPDSHHPTGIPWPQAFLRTLVADIPSSVQAGSGLRDENSKSWFCRVAAGFQGLFGRITSQILTREQYLGLLCGCNDPPDFQDFRQTMRQDTYDPDSEGNWGLFATECFTRTQHRSFFVTDNRYVGLGPHYTQSDDLLCLIPGCNAPLLLRQVEDHYLLVGDCYVYGVMNGEVVQEVKNGHLRLQELKLR